MLLTQSKVTSQGQTSVPAEIRRLMGITPGSVLEWEWDEADSRMTVRRAGRFSSQDIHRVLFATPQAAPQSTDALKEGIRRYIRKRHARH